MRISLPPIGSRRFPLYWGLISSATAIIYWGVAAFVAAFIGYLISSLLGNPIYSYSLWPQVIWLAALLYPFVLNSIPLILLKRYLKLNQKATWITSESISQLVFGFGIGIVIVLLALAKEDYPDYPRTELSFGSLYNLGVYQILAVLIAVWFIISIIQTFTISFKYPKRWLVYSMFTWMASYLLICFSSIVIPEGSLLVIFPVFACLVLKSGLNGLGLYLSGMTIRKESASSEQ